MRSIGGMLQKHTRPLQLKTPRVSVSLLDGQQPERDCGKAKVA